MHAPGDSRADEKLFYSSMHTLVTAEGEDTFYSSMHALGDSRAARADNKLFYSIMHTLEVTAQRECGAPFLVITVVALVLSSLINTLL
jgi:hypothetical protein